MPLEQIELFCVRDAEFYTGLFCSWSKGGLHCVCGGEGACPSTEPKAYIKFFLTTYVQKAVIFFLEGRYPSLLPPPLSPPPHSRDELYLTEL